MLWPVNMTDQMLQGINAMQESISLYETTCQNLATNLVLKKP